VITEHRAGRLIYNAGYLGVDRTDGIVLVQVFYQLPVMTAPLGFNLATTSNGNALITATAVFRNEPYQ